MMPPIGDVGLRQLSIKWGVHKVKYQSFINRLHAWTFSDCRLECLSCAALMDSPAKRNLRAQCAPTTSLSLFRSFFALLRSLPTQATIDFLGLRRVRLNLKNALKFYCIPISLSSFIIICVSPALPRSLYHTFCPSLHPSPSILLSLSL